MTQPTAPAHAPLALSLSGVRSASEPGSRIFELAALAQRERSRHLAAAWRILRDPVEAEDAVQDALASACRKVDAFRDESQLSTWLYRIVINASLMRLRTKHRRPEADLEAIPKLALGCDGRHDESLERRELGDVLLRCAETLSGPQRQLLLSRYVDEIPLRTIAADLGITEGGVKARLHRARAALRSAFFAALGPEAA